MKPRSYISIHGESGAALVTVVIATLLLGTACIAMLSAVGASSRNNTDALNEAKAYWAAESGLQATINVLRNGDVEYLEAIANPELRYNATTFPNGLPYSGDRVTMNSEAQYRVDVSNPDANLPYTYYTTGSFRAGSGSVTEISPAIKICVPDCQEGTANRTEIVYTPQVARNVDYSTTQPLGTFAATKVNDGGTIPTSPIASTFRIEYEVTSPREVSRTIRGRVASSTENDVTLTFDTQVYEIAGGLVELCPEGETPSSIPGTNGFCSNVSLTLTFGAPTATSLYAYVTPLEPYRMKVISTGYGPDGAMKQLEGIVQKNLFDDTPTTSALTMLGSGASITFQPGPGNPTYCGVDPGIEPGDPIPPNNQLDCTPDPNSPSAPSIGVSNPSDLDTVTSQAGTTNGTVVPPPDIITDGPWWTQSAADMDSYINDLRNAAIQDGGYIPDTAGTTNLNSYTIGNYAEGTGLTFCEGSCTVGPSQGGGVLVVTGNFEYSGNYSHRGTIIVTGNMHRNGAGSGVILGNVVIAPYDPNNLAAGFGSPSFTTSGGGTSDIIYTGTSASFNGTSAFTNRMRGVAEK